MNVETLIQELMDKDSSLKAQINTLNQQRDEYALDAVLGDEKAQQAISEFDAKITPLVQERRTIETAIQRLELQLGEERKAEELAAKREFVEQFYSYRDECMVVAEAVAEKIQELRPLLETLNTTVSAKGFNFSTRAGIPHRNLRANTTMEKCIMHASGMHLLMKNPGHVSPAIKKLTDPSSWFNAIIFDHLNRVGEALASQAEIESIGKLLSVANPEEPEAETPKRKVIPKTKIKVVRVKDGLDIVRVTDGDIIAELKDEPNAFSEWFNEPGKQWSATFELEGEAYPSDNVQSDSPDAEDTFRVVHKGKGYWQIQDVNGQDLLDDPIQGKDNAYMIAQQMGLSVK